MNLSEILAINGKTGLFKLISKGKNNFIVESLIDRKRTPTFPHDSVSALDNIAIFTYEEDIPLTEVFKAIYTKENGGKLPEISKDAEKLKRYFEEVLPNYDKERVYIQNIKKVLLWYNLLHDENLFDFTEEPEDVEDNTKNEKINKNAETEIADKIAQENTDI